MNAPNIKAFRESDDGIQYRQWQKFKRAKMGYMIEVQPFVKMLYNLQMTMPKRFILKPDGSLEIPEDQGWPQWAIDQKAEIQECIKSLQDKYFSEFETP